MSISNPTQLTAADIGVYDVRTGIPQALPGIPNPFPNSPLGVHVAIGDLDNDGLGDIIVGPGRGPAQVAVARGEVYPKLEILALGSLPTVAGVRVATGDVDGDGRDDIIVSPATGSASRGGYIKFDGIKGELAPLGTFDDIFQGFSGGVSVATGDLDGNMVTDVVAARAGCCKWDYPIKKAELSTTFSDFGPPIPAGSGGVQVAAGDIDGDDLADLLVLPNNSNSPTGAAQPLMAMSREKHKEWRDLLNFTEPTGVHVALGDVDNDGVPDLVVGSGQSAAPYIKIYGIESTPGAPGTPDVFSAFFKIEIPLFDDAFKGGVRVAVGDINNDGFAEIAYGQAVLPEPATIGSVLAGLGAWLFGSRRRRRDGSPPG